MHYILQVFQDCVAFLEQTLSSENSKKSAYASVTLGSATDEGNEWLADTNALKTEKVCFSASFGVMT